MAGQIGTITEESSAVVVGNNDSDTARLKPFEQEALQKIANQKALRDQVRALPGLTPIEGSPSAAQLSADCPEGGTVVTRSMALTLFGTDQVIGRRIVEMDYSSYQQADGGLSFVRNDYLGLDGAVNITQKLWPTGGTLSVESSLDYLHQSGSGGTDNQFMSLPVAITLSQPLFGVNHLKWDRRIEPLRYREAQARFLTETEQVAMQAINLYFNLLLAGERVNIARQNLQTAEKLYEVALAKREMGTISQNDVLQLRLDVLTARSALTNSESARKAAQFALRSFLDVEADIVATVPEGSPSGLRLDYADVLAHALRNNAQATTMRRRQMEADYAVASARANR